MSDGLVITPAMTQDQAREIAAGLDLGPVRQD